MNGVALTSDSFSYEGLPPDVDALARAAAERIRHRLNRTVQDLVEIGRDLCTAKEALPHGRFGPWVQTQVGVSIETAERWMHIAARLGPIIGSLTTLSPDALYPLAAPSTPDSVIEDVVVGRIEPTPKAIRAEISRRKGPGESSVPSQQSAWKAFDTLVGRYDHVDPEVLTAELLVRLACTCACPS
jgi:hypothetical protein